MLFLVISTPRPERPSDVAATRQGFWPWIARYQAQGVCRHIYARVGRGVRRAEQRRPASHLGEWADLVPAQFDTYPLVDGAAAQALLAAQRTAES